MGALWSRIRGSGSSGTSAAGEQKGVSGGNKKTAITSIGASASAPDTDTVSHPASSPSRERSRGRTRTRTPPPLSSQPSGTVKLKKSTSREQIVDSVAAAGQEGGATMTPPMAQPNAINKNNSGSRGEAPLEPLSLSPTKARSLVAHGAPGLVPSPSTAIPHEFVWRSGGSKVCLTGSFDNWTQSILMTKDQSGIFRATVLLDPHLTWYFKFVVDGVWRCSLDFASEADAQGHVNNVIYPSSSSC